MSHFDCRRVDFLIVKSITYNGIKIDISVGNGAVFKNRCIVHGRGASMRQGSG